MDEADKNARLLLETIANARLKLINVAQSLRSHKDVITVYCDMELRAYESGPTLDTYVDVELRNGKAITWHLDVTWDESAWFIDTEVTLNVSQYQEPFLTFPDRKAVTFDEFINHFNSAVHELIESANHTDLSEI